MRIVAGRLRGRRLAPPADRAIRPTADRARQALFDILTHGPFAEAGLPGLAVLDVCAGTGALGLEALSRGAEAATFLDDSAAAIGLIERNARALDLAGQCLILHRDARRPGPAPRQHQLVFLDPPYGQDLIAPILTALAGNGWLAEGAVLACEGTSQAQGFPDEFLVFDERRYGKTRLALLRYRRHARGS
ncbi:MAG: 16S rRNA (guanine(966)-N(2))-methyltransferase RsmD [Alphaproteobacteria bacterium]|nr:16S rRNA (guanine(966)-N(2))-methyltransferase RsmD [Alphaproteobacteria bacterium]